MRLNSKAVSQILAVVIVIVIIAVAFGGYFALSVSPRPTPNSTISTSNTSASTKVFLYSDIPQEFAMGNFTVDLAYAGTGYITPPVNGTSAMFTGYAYAFNVTTPDGKTTNIYFLWNPPCNINYGLPCQTQNKWVVPNFENNANELNTSIDYLSKSLFVGWFVNSTGLFASFQISPSSTSSIFFNGSTSQVTVYLLTCSVTTYQVWSVESLSNSTTIGTTSTQIQSSNFTTTTNASESVGYVTTTMISHTGTLTGALAYWQVQSCTYVK